MNSLRSAVAAVAIGTSLIVGGPAWAATAAKQPGAQAQTDPAAEKRKTLIAEATSAIAETENALLALDKGRSKEALSALERATGKLEILLARDPQLTLAPAGVTVETQAFKGGREAVKQIRKQAEDLMRDGRLQQARLIMKGLASETVVSVAQIPLATYPAAIKRAAALIDQNKAEEAKRVLQDALNTEVVSQTIIPLPLVAAQGALTTAENLAEKKARTADENARLATALEEARTQLLLAQELGYGVKSDFEPLFEQITEIKTQTADNKAGQGFFDKLKGSLSSLVNAG